MLATYSYVTDSILFNLYEIKITSKYVSVNWYEPLSRAMKTADEGCIMLLLFSIYLLPLRRNIWMPISGGGWFGLRSYDD